MHIAPSELLSIAWQEQLQQVVTCPKALFSLLQLDEQHLPAAMAAVHHFPLRVPKAFIHRIRQGDWHDPLLRQVLPLGVEMIAAPGYSQHPLQEHQYNPLPGLLHKYKSRVLLVVTGACAINCRYCFRRDFAYAENRLGRRQWSDIVTYLSARPDINEVILSGGDPLVAPDNVLAELVSKLSEVKHLRYLRIHTRLPIVIPARVNPSLIHWLTATRLKPIVVLHCNHAQEIDEAVCHALSTLSKHSITLLNQTVLLKNVNDSAVTLAALSHRLFANNVVPYYLHMLDKIQGAAHFDVPLKEARALYQQLLTELPGYLVPKLVREVPGNLYKTPIL